MIIVRSLVLVILIAMTTAPFLTYMGNFAHASNNNLDASGQTAEEAQESAQTLGAGLAFRVALYVAIAAAIAVGIVVFWKRRSIRA